MSPEVRSVTLATGVRLPYVDAGDPAAVPVMLLHGLADSWRAFERVLEHLPPSARFVVPTQRGHGDASRPDSGYGIREFADDVVALMDAVGIAAAVVGGHSSHSIVAQRVAIDHPERVLGLVLIGSPADPARNPRVQAYWDSTMSTLEDPIGATFVRDFQESTLIGPVPEAFVETIVQESLKVPAFVWRATFRGLLESELANERRRITAPTLVVWGDRDAISPRSDQDAIVEGVRGARLVVYEGIGHAPHWEAPARLAADLAGFAAGLSA